MDSKNKGKDEEYSAKSSEKSGMLPRVNVCSDEQLSQSSSKKIDSENVSSSKKCIPNEECVVDDAKECEQVKHTQRIICQEKHLSQTGEDDKDLFTIGTSLDPNDASKCTEEKKSIESCAKQPQKVFLDRRKKDFIDIGQKKENLKTVASVKESQKLDLDRTQDSKNKSEISKNVGIIDSKLKEIDQSDTSDGHQKAKIILSTDTNSHGKEKEQISEEGEGMLEKTFSKKPEVLLRVDACSDGQVNQSSSKMIDSENIDSSKKCIPSKEYLVDDAKECDQVKHALESKKHLSQMGEENKDDKDLFSTNVNPKDASKCAEEKANFERQENQLQKVFLDKSKKENLKLAIDKTQDSKNEEISEKVGIIDSKLMETDQSYTPKARILSSDILPLGDEIKEISENKAIDEGIRESDDVDADCDNDVNISQIEKEDDLIEDLPSGEELSCSDGSDIDEEDDNMLSESSPSDVDHLAYLEGEESDDEEEEFDMVSSSVENMAEIESDPTTEINTFVDEMTPEKKENLDKEEMAEISEGKENLDDEEMTENSEGKESLDDEEMAENSEGKENLDDEEMAENSEGKENLDDEEMAENSEGKENLDDEEMAENSEGKENLDDEEMAENSEGKENLDDEEMAENSEEEKVNKNNKDSKETSEEDGVSKCQNEDKEAVEVAFKQEEVTNESDVNNSSALSESECSQIKIETDMMQKSMEQEIKPEKELCQTDVQSRNMVRIIIQSHKRPLTKEEFVFVKMGQIKPCFVEIKKMNSDILKKYKPEVVKKRIARWAIPFSLQLKVMQDLNRGLNFNEVAALHSISRTSVGRIKARMKMRKTKMMELKALKLSSSNRAGTSKRALTFSTRVRIMGKLERGVSIEALSHEYGINKSTLISLRRMKNQKIRERQNSSESSASQETQDNITKEMSDISTDLDKSQSKKSTKMYDKPSCRLSVIMIIVLQNTEKKACTFTEIKKMVCYLFPYYSKRMRETQWRRVMLSATLKKAKSFFLKTPCKVKGEKYILSLNPIEETNWKEYIQTETVSLRNEAERVMRRPELLESLLLGIVPLDTWNIIDDEFKTDCDGDVAKQLDDDTSESTLTKVNDKEVRIPTPSLSCTKKDGPKKVNTLKRKCDSLSEQPRKVAKETKDSHVSEMQGNSGNTSLLKPVISHDICDTDVNNRLVNLLMGKEKPHAGKNIMKAGGCDKKHKSSATGGRNKSIKFSKKNITETLGVMASSFGKQSVSKDAAVDSISDLLPVKSEMESISKGMVKVKVERQSDECKVDSVVSEEENLPKIVSVEDRAYHMWSPKDEDSSEDVGENLLSSKKKKKSNIKTFGKSLLSLAKKGESPKKRKSLPTNSAVNEERFSENLHHSSPLLSQKPASVNYSKEISSSSKVPFQSKIPTSNICSLSSFNQSFNPSSKHRDTNDASKLISAQGTVSSIPVTNEDVMRPLLTWTPAPSISSAKSKPEKSKSEKSVPKVSDCIKTWQDVFPWMYYVESERAFICRTCEWAYNEQKEIEVFRLQTPKDVYSVAGQLRYHNDIDVHRIVEFKKTQIGKLIDHVYPILKGHLQEISSVQDIIKNVTDLAGGRFPGPQESPQKEYFITFVIKHIAECIEESLFQSLAGSPFFSVITVKDKDYAIIRWLNNKGESEEHFFCSQIGYPGEIVPCLTYLKRRNVDLNKLISYSMVSNMISSNLSNAVMLQVPVRYPPLSVCLDWLNRVSFLKNLFQQLSVLTKLCKSSYHKFAAFPEASEFLNLAEPYSHNCIINERIMNFFFRNIQMLRKIAQDIYSSTGNMEAFGFSVLELKDADALLRCSSLFPKLHSIMSSKNSDMQSLGAELKEFRTCVYRRLGELKMKHSDEYVVFSLIDIFLSHVLLTLQSPGKEVTDIFSKKLRHLTSADIEKIFPCLMSEYQGNASLCLAKLHDLRVQLEKSKDSSLLQLLAILVSRQELIHEYPELYRLYQKITVLPFLHAHVEQSMFNIAAAEVFLSSKVEKRMMLPIALILLEGDTAHEVDQEYIMESWSRKWKLSRLHRHM